LRLILAAAGRFFNKSHTRQLIASGIKIQSVRRFRVRIRQPFAGYHDVTHEFASLQNYGWVGAHRK
jgi:hypothetical protein